jgi:hypothetical protein
MIVSGKLFLSHLRYVIADFDFNLLTALAVLQQREQFGRLFEA